MATMWYQRFVETSYVLDFCNFEQHLFLPAHIPTWIISTYELRESTEEGLKRLRHIQSCRRTRKQ